MRAASCCLLLCGLLSVGCDDGSSGGEPTPDVTATDAAATDAAATDVSVVDVPLVGEGGDADRGVEPGVCSPEALGLVGEAVPFTSLSVDCGDVEREERRAEVGEPAGPKVTVVTSAEDLLELLECPDGEVGVDFTASRVAVIQGYNIFPIRPVQWAVGVEGTIWVDLTSASYSSGIELLPEPYISMVTLPAGDEPVQTQYCEIPHDGPELPSFPE